ncbi:hypothetical protein ACFL3V_04155 [Nanoarchaeota archaeon]
MMTIYISEPWRMFKRSRYVKKHGFKRFKGTPKNIAEQIIQSCWNKEQNYFMVSSGHFCEFYSRDFGMCAEALVKLGHRKKVIQTLDYALSHFKKHRRITTSISPKGICFDFPTYGADSLPFIIRAIKAAKAKQILKKYNTFLKKEISYYFKTVFDRKTNLVKEGAHFSSMKDYSKRNSSCYSNCMLSMLNDDLAALKFYNPFSKYKIRQSILSTFWNGNYFYEDRSCEKTVTGDANTFPFWCGVTNSRMVFNLCMKSMEKARLTKPFLLKYTAKKQKTAPAIWQELLAGDYERDTVWIHLGACFLDVISRFDKKKLKQFLAQYEANIKKYGNFLEVYDRNGKPFKTLFYVTDESMLWVSKYLALKK